MRLTSMKVSAVSNWPVRRKCVAIVRSRAATASGDENMAWYEGSGVGNLYDGCTVRMVPVAVRKSRTLSSAFPNRAREL